MIEEIVGCTRSLSLHVEGRCDLCFYEIALKKRRKLNWSGIFTKEGVVKFNSLLTSYPDMFCKEVTAEWNQLPVKSCLEFCYDDETLTVCVRHLREIADHLDKPKEIGV